MTPTCAVWGKISRSEEGAISIQLCIDGLREDQYLHKSRQSKSQYYGIAGANLTKSKPVTKALMHVQHLGLTG